MPSPTSGLANVHPQNPEAEHANPGGATPPNFNLDIGENLFGFGPSSMPSTNYTRAGPSTSHAVAGPSSTPSTSYTRAGPSTSHVGGSSTRATKRQSETLPSRETPLPSHRVTKVSERHVKKYNARVMDYNIAFQPAENMGPMLDMMPRVNDMFENIIDEMLVGVRERDFVRLVLNAPQLDRPVSLPFIRRDQMNYQVFASKLESTLQSHEDISLDN